MQELRLDEEEGDDGWICWTSPDCLSFMWFQRPDQRNRGEALRMLEKVIKMIGKCMRSEKTHPGKPWGKPYKSGKNSFGRKKDLE